ncbi:MAG: HNH endonuclease [Bacteroidetes bacterium]|nr:HNH endonuclease [Bacteroidota bacterium]
MERLLGKVTDAKDLERLLGEAGNATELENVLNKLPEGTSVEGKSFSQLQEKEIIFHTKAADKGFPGVKVTKNGGPDFSGTDYLYPVVEGQQNIVKIRLTGGRYGDFKAANEAAGFPGAKAPDGYTWHHLDDFNPATGESTMQLITREAHEATYPHKGSVFQYEQANGVKYK